MSYLPELFRKVFFMPNLHLKTGSAATSLTAVMLSMAVSLAGLSACAKPLADDAQIKPYSALEPLTVKTPTAVHEFRVEIADDFSEREQGLMYRKNLPETQGMLFEFPDVAERAFWMKNTVVPLDIIYISPQGRIVSIQKQAQPFDETPLPSFAPAKGVLEIQGGLADKLGIKVGHQIIHPFFTVKP
jgi:uncharacterized membrane protein (UPF0127 family)